VRCGHSIADYDERASARVGHTPVLRPHTDPGIPHTFLRAAAGLPSAKVQDCYAFDVGDFGKLGLLRHIHHATRLRLGVLWWRTGLGSNGNDGKHVGYLKKPAFRACDRELWEEMRRHFDPNMRTIAALQPLLPDGTRFHDVPVPPTRQRFAWLKEAETKVRGSAVVFVDPDNGLTFREPCRSRRHVGAGEIRWLYNQGYSLIVYHTPGHALGHDAQIAAVLKGLRTAVPGLAAVWAARFRRGTSRVFFILAQRKHAVALRAAIGTMQSTEWVRGGHFKLFTGCTRDTSSLPSSDNIEPSSQAAESDVALRRNGAVRVVLNDNGGLNVEANPWLAGIRCPCRLTADGMTFSVVAPFAGRTDMYRISPSALKLARALSFSGDHLSSHATVAFEATVIQE